MELIGYLRRFRNWINASGKSSIPSAQALLMHEQQLLVHGRSLSESVRSHKRIASLSEVEFRVFSQFGDDGIIQWLVGVLEFPSKTFVEFGVGNYRGSNTRFLMMNDNWSGLVMDGSELNVAQIVNSEYFWKYQLSANTVFIDTDNINWHAPGLTEAPFLGGSYPQTRETVSDVQTIEVLARVSRACRTPGPRVAEFDQPGRA